MSKMAGVPAHWRVSQHDFSSYLFGVLLRVNYIGFNSLMLVPNVRYSNVSTVLSIHVRTQIYMYTHKSIS